MSTCCGCAGARQGGQRAGRHGGRLRADAQPKTLYLHEHALRLRRCAPRWGSALADTVAGAGDGAWASLDAGALLRAAGRLVGDNTPEAREAGRRLVAAVRVAFVAGRCGEAPASGALAALAETGDAQRPRDGAQVRPSGSGAHAVPC